MGVLRTLGKKYNTRFHLVGGRSLSKDYLRTFDTVYSSMWLSPMRSGSTVLWDGSALRHYPPSQKEEIRAGARSAISQAGLDYGLIQDDKPSEVSRLAIWSIQQFEESLVANVVRLVPSTSDVDGDSAPETSLEMAASTSSPDTRQIPASVPAVRDIADKHVIPTLAVDVVSTVTEDADGRTIVSDAPVVRSTGSSVRACNTCFVSATCPAMVPDSECAFHLPVEIKTREQIMAVLSAMLEIQTSRVAFAQYAEGLSGGYPDQTVSQEMDRLFKMFKTMRDMEKDDTFVKMTVEARAGAGILSSIFGSRAVTDSPPSIEGSVEDTGRQ